MKRIYLLILTLLGIGFMAVAQSFDYSMVKKAVHPRLLLKGGEEKKLLELFQQHPELQKINQQIIDYSDGLLIKPTQFYYKDAKRLSAAYASVHDILYLSFAYRMTQDEKYSRRAEQEMRALAAFPNWNPSHYLDTSASAFALAIAYDWLFYVITDETKAAVRKAIVEKAFDTSKTPPGDWFYTLDTNWNSVCNTELVAAALAIFEDEPEASKAIIEKCMETIHLPLQAYGPDGAYSEGFSYWEYGTGLQVILHAMLESVFGTDNGLSDAPGFLESATYMLHMVGPTGLCFNYSDCGTKRPACVLPLFWFAKKTNDTSLLWWEKSRLEESNVPQGRYLPVNLCFLLGVDWQNPEMPKQKMWVGKGVTPVILVRTGWNDNQAIFFGAKGGTPKHSHAHMDNGSFVFDAQGVRWAMDLGLQNYVSLEKMNVRLFDPSQNGQKWDILRTNNWHHNTLTINGNKHNADSHASIVKVFDKDSKRGALIDLTETLKYDLRKATRDVSLINNKYLEINDDITTNDEPASVQWTMMTPALPKIIGDHTIELTQNGKTLHLIVDAPKAVEMKIWTNDPEHDYDEPNPGTMRVGFITQLDANKRAKMKVRLVPQP